MVPFEVTSTVTPALQLSASLDLLLFLMSKLPCWGGGPLDLCSACVEMTSPVLEPILGITVIFRSLSCHAAFSGKTQDWTMCKVPNISPHVHMHVTCNKMSPFSPSNICMRTLLARQGREPCNRVMSCMCARPRLHLVTCVDTDQGPEAASPWTHVSHPPRPESLSLDTLAVMELQQLRAQHQPWTDIILLQCPDWAAGPTPAHD